jgi:AmmeMemoRadiSam system protein B
VAGAFYPADPSDLRAMIAADLATAAAHDVADQPAAKAIVAPHAGYVYSGPIAASAYAPLASRRGTITRVVLLGPAHRVALRGMAVPTVAGFDSPLGAVPIDGDARRTALACRRVVADDRPHAGEHSLEVHLPFLQEVLGADGWALLPVVVGHTDPEDVADLLDAVWGGSETLVVVSTDLSHYHDHGTAQRLDAATAAAIVEGRALDIGPSDACGTHPLRGLLVAARRHGLATRLLDLRTSADTAGDPSRVVGYGAFALSAP